MARTSSLARTGYVVYRRIPEARNPPNPPNTDIPEARNRANTDANNGERGGSNYVAGRLAFLRFRSTHLRAIPYSVQYSLYLRLISYISTDNR